MENVDVYNSLPGSFGYRHVSPGNEVRNPENFPYIFKCDYKTPYKYSPYFQRKIEPIENDDPKVYSQISKEDIDKFNKHELTERFSYLKGTLSASPYMHYDFFEGDVKKNAREYVRSSFAADALKLSHKELNIFSQSNPEIRYMIRFSSVGTERSAHTILDGDVHWQEIYFKALQMIHDYDDHLRENYDYKQPMYVGRTKMWQAINDIYGKEEVDKIQVAIGAPVQEQLDIWEEENQGKYLQMPICNENQAKFRDTPKHYERLDHDYDNILYERARNQAFENMRNMRYWELEEASEKEEASHHH